MATFLYNPDRKPKDQLLAEFVVRTEIYEEIMQDLETSSMQYPEQHYLLVGQRGTGKTTLLNRLKYGIEDSKVLHKKVIPILFSEEQYNVSELVNLWESIGQYLEDYHGFKGLYEEIESNLDKSNFEELSYDILEKHLKKQKKKLVLLIDNIGDLLKKMEKTEVYRFRELLQTKSEMRLIVGSPFYLETLLDYHQPFFEFFKVLRLDGLNKQETQSLLLKLAQINGEEEKIKKIIAETPERIETLRTLTGGVPRTIALMFNIFIEYTNEDTVKDLEKILDAVTPLYKHRMDDLPTQQQKIVDAVAKNWDGISVKELKEKLRIESKIISAQLRQLEKNQIIDIVETGTKNNIYLLKERFFNIWYLMRYGRKYDRQRVIWLVKFLESWCTAQEIEHRIVDYIKKLKDGQLDNELISFYGELYSAIDNLRSEMKLVLKESTPVHLSKRIRIDDREIIRMAQEKFANKEFEKAVKLLKDLVRPDELSERLVIKMMLELNARDNEYFIQLVKEVHSKFSKKNEDLELDIYEELLLLVFSNYVCDVALFRKNYEEAHKLLDRSLDAFNLNNKISESTLNLVASLTFLSFLIFDQFNVVLSVFEKRPELKDKLKPTYYATLKMSGKNSELKKMGPELKEGVNELIKLAAHQRKKISSILST